MNKRILIVEDEGLIALHTEEMLTHAGYEPLAIFSRGEDVLAYIAASPPPDVILMDIGLAGTLNGIETAQRIREKSDIPVIFLTAYSDQAHLSEIREVSPGGYLIKPFREQDLVAKLETTLAQARSQAARHE